MVCTCLHRTEAEISDAVARLGLETFEDVAAAVLAGSGCTTCRPEIETILEATLRAVPDGAVKMVVVALWAAEVSWFDSVKAIYSPIQDLLKNC